MNARNVSSPSMLDWLSDKPWIREEIMQNFTALGQKIESLAAKWSNSHLEKLGFRLKNLHFFYEEALANDYGMILELDSNGRLLGSLHSIDGTNYRLSEVVEGPTENPYERVLYIGSYTNPYILKLTIPNFTQDYQQKNKQTTSNSALNGNGNKNVDNGVDFSLLPYGSTRRTIATTLNGNNIDLIDDDDRAMFFNAGNHHHRRIRKEASRYTSSA